MAYDEIVCKLRHTGRAFLSVFKNFIPERVEPDFLNCACPKCKSTKTKSSMHFAFLNVEHAARRSLCGRNISTFAGDRFKTPKMLSKNKTKKSSILIKSYKGARYGDI